MIKLTANNEVKIQAEIKAVEGKARERKITVSDIKKELENLEKKLRIAKKALEGTIVVIDCNAQAFPNAYHGTPVSTIFRAKFFRGTWQINEIFRGPCSSKTADITLSETAKVAFLEVNSKY